MGEYVPLYISFGILLIIGVFLPLIASSFIDFEVIELSGFLGSMDTLIREGINLDVFDVTFFGIDLGIPNFDIFGMLGETIRDYFSNLLVTFSVIPVIILIPLISLMMVGFVYTIFKLIRG